MLPIFPNFQHISSTLNNVLVHCLNLEEIVIAPLKKGCCPFIQKQSVTQECCFPITVATVFSSHVMMRVAGHLFFLMGGHVCDTPKAQKTGSFCNCYHFYKWTRSIRVPCLKSHFQTPFISKRWLYLFISYPHTILNTQK